MKTFCFFQFLHFCIIPFYHLKLVTLALNVPGASNTFTTYQMCIAIPISWGYSEDEIK